jgi:CubicO group peptidase (beta-lactamase class C family)
MGYCTEHDAYSKVCSPILYCWPCLSLSLTVSPLTMTNSLVERLRAHTSAIAELFVLSGAPSLSVGVFHNGHIVHTTHMGRRNIGDPTPPDDDTMYCVASTFKIVTACAVAILVSDGELAWDEPIRNYLPGFRRRDAFGEQASIRDLLSNRTGLPMAGFYWGQKKGEQLLPKTQFVDMVDSIKTVGPFRSTFVYSQWNYCLLQLIVESVTGKTFGSHVRDAIFEPLGLKTPTFEEFSGSNVAGPHSTRSSGWSGPIVINQYTSAGGLAAGAGGKSSLKDQLLLYMALLDAYQHQTTNKVDSTPNSPFKQLRTVFSPQIAITGSTLERQAYCLGIYRTRLPGNLSCASLNGGLPQKQIPIFGAAEEGGSIEEVFHHTGMAPGYVGTMMLVPRTRSGVAVLSNATPLMDAPDFTAQLLLSVLLSVKAPKNLHGLAALSVQTQLGWYMKMKAALDSFKTDTPPTHPLAEYAGEYFNSPGNFKIVVTESSTGLLLSCQGSPITTYDLKPLDRDTFFWDVNRDLELEQGSNINPLLQFHIIHFKADKRGIGSLSWQHDRLMEADIFQKRGEESARL